MVYSNYQTSRSREISFMEFENNKDLREGYLMKNVNSSSNKETLNTKNKVSMPSIGEKAKAVMNSIATQMAPDSTFQSSEWNNLSVGALVHLGMKKRSLNDHSITPYPVAWRVLEIDSEHNKALLISDKALDLYADDDKKDEKKILDYSDITNARIFKGRQFGIQSPVIGYTHGDTEYFIRCLGIFTAPKKISSTSKFN